MERFTYVSSWQSLCKRMFFFKIIFPDDYPNSGPEILFLTPIYHLNIKYFVHPGYHLGRIELTTLNFRKPGDSIRNILPHVFVLLYKNSPDCAYDDVNNTRKNEFIYNRPLFEKKVKYFTKKYANYRIPKVKEYPNGWDFSFNEEMI